MLFLLDTCPHITAPCSLKIVYATGKKIGNKCLENFPDQIIKKLKT